MLVADPAHHEDGFRLVESGEVVEIRILPILVLHVVVTDRERRSEYDENRPAHLLEQPAPAFGVDWIDHVA